jgi:hypothetical protein
MKKEDISDNLGLPHHYSHSPMKKNNNYRPLILDNNLYISTTKTSVEYAHQTHAETGFFDFNFVCFWKKLKT